MTDTLELENVLSKHSLSPLKYQHKKNPLFQGFFCKGSLETEDECIGGSRRSFQRKMDAST
ncbi:hypothetical protein DC20_09385 [Rufibacter tibetensis]|uniref:Uncharacterized protein n=1 Tax=Rufibacter tibetensis TaxID=512763 RepID=A0A0P0CV12_9BACT|nr:hypothetical protein DC20_09385 [Rufibacter tibetensis]